MAHGAPKAKIKTVLLSKCSR